MSKQIIFCKNCCLTSDYPNIKFINGICNYCNEFNYNEYKKNLIENKLKLKEFLINLSKEKKQYHCLVALSGGKDSSYTCYLLKKKYNLNIIAITVENGFLSKQALNNCKILSKQLDFKHLLIKPGNKRFVNLYKNSLKKRNPNNIIKRSSDICSNCINLINKIMINYAVKKNIPIIAGGYISGQVPEGSLILNLNLNLLLIKNQSIRNFNKYILKKSDIKNFKYPSLSIINPLLSESYNEIKIFNTISKLGWKKSKDTGIHSSNCKINDLGIQIHLQKYGFHPYSAEIASQIRTGQIQRSLAIKKVTSKISNKSIVFAAKKINYKI